MVCPTEISNNFWVCIGLPLIGKIYHSVGQGVFKAIDIDKYNADRFARNRTYFTLGRS